MKRLIIFLIRNKLGLKLGEEFRFTNQKSRHNTYFFDKYWIMKKTYLSSGRYIGLETSSVSFNWLLHLNPKNDICKVENAHK